MLLWQALCGLVLLGVTWRLWWPGSEFPRIPWFAWGLSVPEWVDAVACVVLVGGLIGLIVSHVRSPQAVPAIAEKPVPRLPGLRCVLVWDILASLGLLVVLDQHRLQPWVWQMLLWCVVYLATPKTLLWCLRWLTVSVYFWSGVSKLDAAFPEAHGRLLVDGLTRALGIDTQFWEPETLSNLSRVFPWGELLLAIWLAGWMLVSITFTTDHGERTVPTRWAWRMLRVSCGLAMAMHLTLMLIVGPFGLNHEPAVLVWNVFFIGQAWLLFGRRDAVANRAVQRSERTVADRFITGFTLAAVIFPLTSFWGVCDHWPAWSVYSSRPAIVEVWIDADADADEQLPPELQACLKPAPPLETRQEFNLDAWSYREQGCPLYPQERYRLALAREFLSRYELLEAAHVRVLATPNWWTGERQIEELNATDLRQRLERFWWNTRAR